MGESKPKRDEARESRFEIIVDATIPGCGSGVAWLVTDFWVAWVWSGLRGIDVSRAHALAGGVQEPGGFLDQGGYFPYVECWRKWLQFFRHYGPD